jgi:hypothetical protein
MKAILLVYILCTVYSETNFLETTRILQESPSVDIWAVHGISLMLCWGLLMFFGYCAARFLKHHKWWIYIHLGFSIIPAYWTFGMLIATLSVSNCVFYI